MHEYKLLRKVNGIQSYDSDNVSTKKNLACKTDVSFLKTISIDPQLPHVDYPWNCLKPIINTKKINFS